MRYTAASATYRPHDYRDGLKAARVLIQHRSIQNAELAEKSGLLETRLQQGLQEGSGQAFAGHELTAIANALGFDTVSAMIDGAVTQKLMDAPSSGIAPARRKRTDVFTKAEEVAQLPAYRIAANIMVDAVRQHLTSQEQKAMPAEALEEKLSAALYADIMEAEWLQNYLQNTRASVGMFGPLNGNARVDVVKQFARNVGKALGVSDNMSAEDMLAEAMSIDPDAFALLHTEQSGGAGAPKRANRSADGWGR